MNDRGPDFDELVGPEVEPSERARLLRVHEALVEAGPPPELPAAAAPPTPHVVPLKRRRRVGLLALAAAWVQSPSRSGSSSPRTAARPPIV